MAARVEQFLYGLFFGMGLWVSQAVLAFIVSLLSGAAHAH